VGVTQLDDGLELWVAELIDELDELRWVNDIPVLYFIGDLWENMGCFSLELWKYLHHNLIDSCLDIIRIESGLQLMVGRPNIAK